jgi:hypothetical protein
MLILILSLRSIAQTTKVSGKIIDIVSHEPLPFVNILLKGTQVGVTSDVNGLYSISSTEKCDSIIVSYVGYNRITKVIKRGVSQQMNIALSQGVDLTEIEVRPGENPAHRILRKIIANKDKNNRERLDAYEYEVYNKVEFDLNNLSKKFQKNTLLKPFSFVFNDIDSSNANIFNDTDSSSIKQKPYLPFYMTEALSDYYYRKSPKVRNEIVKASKAVGKQDATFAQFMGDMYQNVNVYNNTIIVFGKNFISPISDNALAFYKFYLIDSMVLDGHKCYQLKFKPKFKQELTFSGNLWTADTSFAIKRLEMSIADDANINFINTTNVIQEYTQVDSAWMMSKERLVIDFNPFPVDQKKDGMGIYGRKTASYSNFKINKPKEDKFYSYTEHLKVADNVFNRSDKYWEEHRHDTLDKNEKTIYHLVDTIQKLPAYKTYYNSLYFLARGYKAIGNFEYGPYYNVFSHNTIEGDRFRFGGRTSSKFSKWYQLNGYVAYGTRDEQLKYNIGILGFFSKNPRSMYGMNYKSDMEILGQSQNGYTPDNLFASFFRIAPLSKLTLVKQTNAFVEREWFTGFNTRLSIYNRKMTPVGSFQYVYQKEINDIVPIDNITTTEIRLLARIAYHEKFLGSDFNRVSLSTRYPIVQAQYTIGLKGIFGGNYNYQKFSINLEDRIRINPIGYFDYMFELGKIFGQVPYPLLELHGGNETYYYDPYAYNAMNYYEFASDQYASASIQHHFDGFFFDRVPLLRKLKWREVVGAKGVVGSINDKNRELMVFPSTLNSLINGPYVETNAGIENIFKVLRFDGVWRLTYLNNPKIKPFSIRFSFQFAF